MWAQGLPLGGIFSVVKRKGERRDASTKEQQDQSEGFVGQVRYEKGSRGDCAVIEVENVRRREDNDEGSGWGS